MVSPTRRRHPNSCTYFRFPLLGLLRQARIVYFNAAATFDDADFKARLGMQSYYDDALTGAPRVMYTGAHNNFSGRAATLSNVAEESLE